MTTDFSQFSERYLSPSRLVILVITILNLIGFWHYEQIFWLKVLLSFMLVFSYFIMEIANSIQLLATFNIFLTLRNIYFIYFVEIISFNLIMVLGFIAFMLIIFIVIYFEKKHKIIKDDKNILIYTSFSALSLIQLQFLMLYWRGVPETTLAILITLVYYIFIRTIEIEEDYKFKGKEALKIFAISAIMAIVIVTSLSWREF